MTEETVLTAAETEQLAREALLASGADEAAAQAVAASVQAAEQQGMRNLGLVHLLDYCASLRAGRIDGRAETLLEQPTPVLFQLDAQQGVAQTGFDRVFADLVAAARQYGVAIMSLRNGYTCGALGYYVQRLAACGLVAQAAANAGPAVVTAGGAGVFGTNPLAFAVPGENGPLLIIDQSSSASAIVNIREAAAEGRELPPGWAVDAEGQPTCDPKAALSGALQAFGGYKGTNIAMMVEMLSAGLTGANWSCDAGSFMAGEDSPGVGLLVIAINPQLLAGDDFYARTEAYLQRFSGDYNGRIPGAQRLAAEAEQERLIQVPAALLAQIREYCG